MLQDLEVAAVAVVVVAVEVAVEAAVEAIAHLQLESDLASKVVTVASALVLHLQDLVTQV